MKGRMPLMSGYDEKFKKRAVALKYDNDNTAAPIIVASGMGYTAEKILEVASQNDIPVYEDTSLATMLSRLELGAEIPPELYKAIVDIYIYFLNFSPNKQSIVKEEENKNVEQNNEEEQNKEVEGNKADGF